MENCVLRLLQAADYEVARAEVGIIHIDEVDKLARRGAGDGFATWGGGRDVGGEGVQQAFLRLLEGTSITLSAKPPPASSSSTTSPSSGGLSSGANGLGSGSSRDALGEGWDSLPRSGQNSGAGPKKGVRDGLPGFGASSSRTFCCCTARSQNFTLIPIAAKGETFVVDTSNILFICSGAFIGLDMIVNSRLGKGVSERHLSSD